MAYLNPTDQAGYTAHMPNSAGLRAGDQVRVAGIPVGKVTSVRLDGVLVEMKFDVENSVAVGSDSTLDIKLLTPLGGHYVALDPKGAVPLGRNGIPPHRITLPFEVNDIIQAATPVVKKVDGEVIARHLHRGRQRGQQISRRDAQPAPVGRCADRIDEQVHRRLPSRAGLRQ